MNILKKMNKKLIFLHDAIIESMEEMSLSVNQNKATMLSNKVTLHIPNNFDTKDPVLLVTQLNRTCYHRYNGARALLRVAWRNGRRLLYMILILGLLRH